MKQTWLKLNQSWKYIVIHRYNARKSHEYYFETKKRCASEWKDIQALEAKLDKTESEIGLLTSYWGSVLGEFTTARCNLLLAETVT